MDARAALSSRLEQARQGHQGCSRQRLQRLLASMTPQKLTSGMAGNLLEGVAVEEIPS
jgi:hypothetical protein